MRDFTNCTKSPKASQFVKTELQSILSFEKENKCHFVLVVQSALTYCITSLETSLRTHSWKSELHFDGHFFE